MSFDKIINVSLHKTKHLIFIITIQKGNVLGKGEDLLSLLANCSATSILRTSQIKQEADVLIQQAKNYRQNQIKLMDFHLYSRTTDSQS